MKAGLSPAFLFAAGTALQLIAQIGWCALNRQGVRCRIPENAFAQQHRIEVQGQAPAASAKFRQLAQSTAIRRAALFQLIPLLLVNGLERSVTGDAVP